MKRLVAILCCLVIVALSIPFSASAAGGDMEFKGQIFGLTAILEGFETGKVHVLDRAEKTKDFIDDLYSNEYMENDTKLRDYCNSLPKNFYEEKALVFVTVYTPELGYAMTSLRVIKGQNEINIDAIIYGGGPCEPANYMIVVEIGKDDLAEADSVTAKVDVRQFDGYDPDGIEYETSFFELDWFPGLDADGEGPQVFVIDSKDKLTEFLALEFSEGGNELHLRDYLNGIEADFFKDNALLIRGFLTGYPNHNFVNANLSKVGGVMTIDCEFTLDLGFAEDICGYYAVAIEIDKGYLWDVEFIDVTTTNVTDYAELDFTGRIFTGKIQEEDLMPYVPHGNFDYPDPIIVTDKNGLDNLTSICDCESLKRYADGLGENFFESRMLIAVYREFDYDNVYYKLVNIIDDVDGSGDFWSINITASQYNRVKGETQKLFVFEVDNEYANKEFYVNISKINIKGDVNGNGLDLVEPMDYVLLKRFYFGTYRLDEHQQKMGDINGNGEIDSMDYILLKRAYFGTYEI